MDRKDVVDNIPCVAAALRAGLGLAGAVPVVAVTVAAIGGHWDEIAALFRDGGT